MTIRMSPTELFTATELALIDQDVSSASAPVFAVTNFTGSAAGIDSSAAAHIADAGNDHSYVEANLVQVVITAVGGTGGAPAGTLSVQVNDLSGVAITRAVTLRLLISDTSLFGSADPATTCQFDTATTGTMVIGTGMAEIVATTDATGLFECSTTNAADETNYFSAATADGGTAAVANSCLVTQCQVASATWN